MLSPSRHAPSRTGSARRAAAPAIRRSAGVHPDNPQGQRARTAAPAVAVDGSQVLAYDSTDSSSFNRPPVLEADEFDGEGPQLMQAQSTRSAAQQTVHVTVPPNAGEAVAVQAFAAVAEEAVRAHQLHTEARAGAEVARAQVTHAQHIAQVESQVIAAAAAQQRQIDQLTMRLAAEQALREAAENRLATGSPNLSAIQVERNIDSPMQAVESLAGDVQPAAPSPGNTSPFGGTPVGPAMRLMSGRGPVPPSSKAASYAGRLPAVPPMPQAEVSFGHPMGGNNPEMLALGPPPSPPPGLPHPGQTRSPPPAGQAALRPVFDLRKWFFGGRGAHSLI